MALPIEAGEWSADNSHSRIGFTGKHLGGLAKVRGSFKEFNLNVEVGDTLESSKVTATVDLLSVDTGNADRDNHLKSEDFFGASENPEINFVSTAISGTPDDFKITGAMTINGKTLPVTFDAEFGGSAQDPWGNTKAGFEAKAEINRTDFGINWNVPVAEGLLVSEKIKIEIDVELAPAQ
ncbi:MAG: YceI family protein [Acidimicrobiia bacterium]